MANFFEFDTTKAILPQLIVKCAIVMAVFGVFLMVATSSEAGTSYRIQNKSAANIEVVNCIHHEQHITISAGKQVYINTQELCFGTLRVLNAFGTEILVDNPIGAAHDTILVTVEGSLFGQWTNKWYNNEPVKPTEFKEENGGDGSYSATYNTLKVWFF